MKRKIFRLGLIVAMALATAPTSAQLQRSEQEITRDTITRWIYHNSALTKKVLKPVKTSEGKIYSVWQQAVTDSLQRWIQLSWYPRAGACYVLNSVVPGSLYENTQPGPIQAYGISYHQFPASYSNRLKKLDVGGEAHEVLSILANGPIGTYIKILSGKGRNWFITTPSLDVASAPTGDDDDGLLDELKNYPALAPYLHWHRQYRNHTIVLAKDNKLPFSKVTVGEYLQAFEEFTKSRATTDDTNYKLPAEFVAQELKKIPTAKQRLMDKLSEPVRFGSEDGYYDPSNICNGKNCRETFEIYQLSSESIELMKKDKPLWINITLKWSRDDLRDYHVYQSICRNFNFDFLYNYFFAPEKMNSKVYKPVNPPQKNIPRKAYVAERSALVKEAKNNPNIMFLEDFSGNAPGKEPVGWFSTGTNTSGISTTFATVKQPKNKSDLWLQLIPRQAAVSNAIRNPLPQNFTISFEINCTENYGSSAVSFFLSDMKDNSQILNSNFGLENLGSRGNNTLLLKIRPAVNNNEGIGFSFCGPKGDPKYSNVATNLRKISSFTGAADSRNANVEIKVSGTALKITINRELVVDERNIIPAGVVFSTMTWAALSSVMESGDEVYLGKVKIEKN